MAHEQIMYIISYGDDGSVRITATDPNENYHKAVDERVPLCKCCVQNLDTILIR